MSATVTLLGSTFNTTSGTHTVTATPAVGDLIVIVHGNTGNATVAAPTDNNSSGTYTVIKSALKNSSADALVISVRTALIGSAVSTVFAQSGGTTTGGGLAVYKITGMTAAGLAAVRQSAAQANQASGGTPTPVFGSTSLSSNPIIGAVFNATNAATLTPRANFTEDVDTGWATPTTGIESMHRNSGETSTSLAWGSTSGSAFSSVAVEFQFNTAPTTALNAPSDTGTVATTTPQVTFTGTDADSDTITYAVDISNATDFSGFTDNSIYMGNAGTPGFAQSFTPSSTITLGSAIFKLSAAATPTGTVSAKIYAHSGTYGTSGAPTGSALATSDALNISTVPGSAGWVEFTFSGVNQISLTSGTHYFVSLEKGDNSFPNGLNVFFGSAGAAGNIAVLDSTPAWSFFSTSDVAFGIFDSTVSSPSVISSLSASDTGFTDITNGAHTDPFTSGEQIGYTVQAGDALTNGTTYFWRARGNDPSGTNSYGAWSSTRSFTVSTGGGGSDPTPLRAMMGLGS